MGSRILAVDYGAKRIGLALSDETGTLARPLRVIEQSEQACETIAGVAREQRVGQVIVGRPSTLRHERSRSTEEAEAFAARLRECLPPEVDMVLWDERLTTKQALSLMREVGTDERRGRARVDMVSAALLLQSFLDRSRSAKAGEQ